MKAYEIALYLIILQASIGLVNSIGVFEHNYVPTPENEYITWDISHIGAAYGNQTQPSIWDAMVMAARMAWEALIGLLKVLLAVVIIYPTLVNVFMINPAISGLIQVAIYVVYGIAIIQFKTGKNIRYME
jgi:hypothetical protein